MKKLVPYGLAGILAMLLVWGPLDLQASEMGPSAKF
jgi:hypothetical protein